MWQHFCPRGLHLGQPWHCCTSSPCAYQTTWLFSLPNNWKVKDLCRNKLLISNALLHKLELPRTTVSEFLLMILQYPLTYSSILWHHDKIFMIAIKIIPSSTLAACLPLWQRVNGTNIEKIMDSYKICLVQLKVPDCTLQLKQMITLTLITQNYLMQNVCSLISLKVLSISISKFGNDILFHTCP